LFCAALPQVLYNAQMIRTWSLLLRTSHRGGYIVAGRFDATALVESPYLMHPIEHKTAGGLSQSWLLLCACDAAFCAC
jgi:DNA polymerase delta subunit 1